MTRKNLDARHAFQSFAFWNPFHLQTLKKSLNPSDLTPSKPYLSNRSLENLDLSKLSLLDDDKRPIPRHQHFRWIARKRRRRGSRSLSGRSSDKSSTLRCCSLGLSAANATCSDFPVAAATDSSGELFANGSEDLNWAVDISGMERENSGTGLSQIGFFEGNTNESGYGSEPGYRGDAEFGNGDELEEENDGQLLFWGNRFEDADPVEITGENTFAVHKTRQRCRRKKHDSRWPRDPMKS